jgi:hypothetical protein
MCELQMLVKAACSCCPRPRPRTLADIVLNRVPRGAAPLAGSCFRGLDWPGHAPSLGQIGA